MFWVYFAGTRNGRWIEAANMKSAKAIFAMQEGVPVTGWIQASRKGPMYAR